MTPSLTDPTLASDLRTWLTGPGKGWEPTEPGSLVVRALARDEAQAARIEELEGVIASARQSFSHARSWFQQRNIYVCAASMWACEKQMETALTGGNTP